MPIPLGVLAVGLEAFHQLAAPLKVQYF